MAVTLKTLLLAAPFPTEDRNEILRRYDELDENQKTDLTITAWEALSETYFARLQYETKKILLEIQQGRKKFNPNDFTEVEAKLIHEFAQKLQSAETEEQISEVKKQLETYKTKPMTQDKRDSAPPPQRP